MVDAVAKGTKGSFGMGYRKGRRVVHKIQAWRGEGKVKMPGKEAIHYTGLCVWWPGEGLWLLCGDGAEVTVTAWRLCGPV